MSLPALGWAYKQRVGSPARKVVLLALAHHQNYETDLCCPSLKTLQDETELSRSSVCRALADLEDLHLIERRVRKRGNGSNSSTQYVLQTETRLVPQRDGDSPTVAPLELELELEVEEPSADKPPRPRNHVWDALVKVTGFNPEGPSETRDFAKTVNEITAVLQPGIVPEQIEHEMRRRMIAFERTYDGVQFTHRVLRNRWGELAYLDEQRGGNRGPFAELQDGETFDG